jgi:ADP-heptose:LPS heptosyltransferase
MTREINGETGGYPLNFLIIRFSSIGDIVLTTPLIRCLKKQVEGAAVHFLTKPAFAPVLRANPWIDHIHEFHGYRSAIKALRDEQFTYIIDLHHNLRSGIIKSRLPAISFSFNKLNIEKWLLVNLRINQLPEIHIVDRYLATLSVFDVVNDGGGLDYFIPPAEEIDMADLPAPFREGYILFAIGANHATKQLPPEKIISVCKKLGLPVILAGGKEDAGRGDAIAAGCGSLVWNACGKYTISQSASLVRQARVVISHDTGLMHIAAAFRKKIISVWGNTVPSFGMSPYMPHPASVIFGVEGLKCRPCSKLGYQKCPRGHFRCMMDQDAGEIAACGKKLFHFT